ncbi:MAG: hypothetical protein Q6K80_12725 [Thermostichus sp. DG_1_6_bins_120]
MNRSRDRWKKLYPESDATDEAGILVRVYFPSDNSGSESEHALSGGQQIRVTGCA